jgi:hypothetical protein
VPKTIGNHASLGNNKNQQRTTVPTATATTTTAATTVTQENQRTFRTSTGPPILAKTCNINCARTASAQRKMPTRPLCLHVQSR